MPHFSAPWDRQLKVATTVVVAFLAALAAGLVGLGLFLGGADLELFWPFLLGPVLVAAVIGGSWALAPRGFAVEGAELRIARPLRPVRIPLSRVRAVSLLPAGDLAGSLRLGGNGGLFGFYGRFWSRRLGAYRLYATRRTDLVRVDTDDELFVLSPGEPGAFVDTVLARAPAAKRGASPRPAASARAAGMRVLRALGLAVAALLLVVAGLLAGTWGLAPVGTEVSGDAIRVERRWAGQVEIPLSGVRSAEVMAFQYGRRWWRTNGTAFGATRFGRFASRELGPFRLWAWRYGPYVLLETDGGRVVLTPDDPERFVAEVRARLHGG